MNKLPIYAVFLLSCFASSEFAVAEGSSGIDADEQEQLMSRFEREIWPLLGKQGVRLRDGKATVDASCIDCHDAEHSSELHFLESPRANFKMLLAGGYFDTENPDSIVVRLSTKKRSRRMPTKKFEAWKLGDIEQVKNFAAAARKLPGNGGRQDEMFPSALLEPYEGQRIEGTDNTFITFRQLRGKIATIFDDHWIRSGEDLFEKNIALFGGADFKKRFNESSSASPSFLSALDTMALDVASRAYGQRSGPFRGRFTAKELDSRDMSNDAQRVEIIHLFRALLYRSPDASEITAAAELLRDIYAEREAIESSRHSVSFELTVRDPEYNLLSRRDISIAIRGDGYSVARAIIDQTGGEKWRGSSDLRSQELPMLARLRKNDDGQSLFIENKGTYGVVSFLGVELRARGVEIDEEPILILAGSPQVQLDGAWKARGMSGRDVFIDEDLNKGGNFISVNLQVPRNGEYSVRLLWGRGKNSAPSVPVELIHRGEGRFVAPPAADQPPPGEAYYFIDQTEDSIAFRDLGDRFLFDARSHIELNNRGTKSRVTADAIRFVPDDGKGSFLIDNHEAEGAELWQNFSAGRFRAYNRVGKDTYHDGNKKKGELFLRYIPSSKKEWRKNVFYRPQVSCPGKRDHEKRAPFTVRARASSPLVRLIYAPRTSAGSDVILDASGSFNLQRSNLRFTWRQTSGPPIKLHAVDREGSAAGSIQRFVAPTRSSSETAWIALARALMRHPDFLFTRPPSIDKVADPTDRKRLLLVKVAQDLVGRPPTSEETSALDGGKSIDRLIDEYLDSSEFRDFYFHRIRLYLESYGTGSQDEPARIWCHVAFRDLPFQEILIAEYTIDKNFEKISRPTYHGKTGLLTAQGFIEGKPGLPHFNYAAQVAEKFLGYVFELPASVQGDLTALSTTDPDSTCYSCHKILTPLARQRLRWTDKGRYVARDKQGKEIDDSDGNLVESYAFKGRGMEAFATQAVKKERFIRTMINAHFIFYFGREMRHEQDERQLYKQLWDRTHTDGFTIRGLIRALLKSPNYREAAKHPVAAASAENAAVGG